MANQFASKILILFILVFLSNSVLSQKIIKPPEKEPEKESRSDGVEFMSFVFNETITKIGADFYRMFNNDWENPTDVEGVSLHIKEKPRPGMGALLMIEVDNKVIFQTFVRPNQEQLRQAVKSALQRVESYFINYELIQKQLNTEDFSGSGLF